MCSEVAKVEMAEPLTVIRVSNLSKTFAIYEKPQDRLKQIILPRIQRIFGLKPSKYYEPYEVLKDINFEVKAGETIGVIGRNGAGKSTLLQIITGTLTATSGQVEVDGRVAALLELGSGFNPEFTGHDNVYMNASILGLSTLEIDSKYQDIINFAEIGDYIHQPVKTYSSGMLLRLAFAVIAHVDADILIIDEALAVGDAFFTQKCMRFLRQFMKTGTVLFVSHDTGAVLNLCDTALMLEGGEISAKGDAKGVVEKYLAEAAESNFHDIRKDSEILPEPADQEIIADFDMRKNLINSSTLRNDIQVFSMDPDCAGFGAGEAVIEGANLTDEFGQSLSWAVGGEIVKLKVVVRALRDLESPIIGFHFKDRLGQVIFADNTYLANMKNEFHVKKNQLFSAEFLFRMPVLQKGNYTIDAAVATGTQDKHVQQDWRHDILALLVHSTSLSFGIVGVPILDISMKVETDG